MTDPAFRQDFGRGAVETSKLKSLGGEDNIVARGQEPDKIVAAIISRQF